MGYGSDSRCFFYKRIGTGTQFTYVPYSIITTILRIHFMKKKDILITNTNHLRSLCRKGNFFTPRLTATQPMKNEVNIDINDKINEEVLVIAFKGNFCYKKTSRFLHLHSLLGIRMFWASRTRIH
jgi:hypothetical protein